MDIWGEEMNKRKAKRFTIRNPFSILIFYVDTDNLMDISAIRHNLDIELKWWKLFKRIIVPKGVVEVVRI